MGNEVLRPMDRNPDGTFSITLESGQEVAQTQLFDEKQVDGMNMAGHLLRAPESLANVLGAAGLSPLERCRAILDERAAAREGKAGEK